MEWLWVGGLEQSWMEKAGECEEKRGARQKGLGRRGRWALVGIMVPWPSGCGAAAPPPSVGHALVWGMGHRDPEGESAGAACSPVLVSVDFLCFCP